MFYLQAKQKGINITSRYRGISVNHRAGAAPYWQAYLTSPTGKYVIKGGFPLTRIGEESARRWWEEKCIEFGYDYTAERPYQLFKKNLHKSLVK